MMLLMFNDSHSFAFAMNFIYTSWYPIPFVYRFYILHGRGSIPHLVAHDTDSLETARTPPRDPR